MKRTSQQIFSAALKKKKKKNLSSCVVFNSIQSVGRHALWLCLIYLKFPDMWVERSLFTCCIDWWWRWKLLSLWAPPTATLWAELEWGDNSFNSCKLSDRSEYTQGRFIWFMINSCECGWSTTLFWEAASQNRSNSQRFGQNNCISPEHLFRVSKLVSAIISL